MPKLLISLSGGNQDDPDYLLLEPHETLEALSYGMKYWLRVDQLKPGDHVLVDDFDKPTDRDTIYEITTVKGIKRWEHGTQ